MNALLISLFAFATASAVGWLFAVQLGVGQGQLRARFQRYASEPALVVDTGLTAGPPVRLPGRLEAQLEQAGYDWSPARLAGMIGLHVLAGVVAGATIGLAPYGGLAGALVLWMRLRAAQQRRTRKLAEQLPDALMLMATALRSGLGFQQAHAAARVVAPAVDATDEARLRLVELPSLVVHEAGAAMSALVEERVRRSPRITRDEERYSGRVVREERAGLGQERGSPENQRREAAEEESQSRQLIRIART